MRFWWWPGPLRCQAISSHGIKIWDKNFPVSRDKMSITYATSVQKNENENTHHVSSNTFKTFFKILRSYVSYALDISIKDFSSSSNIWNLTAVFWRSFANAVCYIRVTEYQGTTHQLWATFCRLLSGCCSNILRATCGDCFVKEASSANMVIDVSETTLGRSRIGHPLHNTFRKILDNKIIELNE